MTEMNSFYTLIPVEIPESRTIKFGQMFSNILVGANLESAFHLIEEFKPWSGP